MNDASIDQSVVCSTVASLEAASSQAGDEASKNNDLPSVFTDATILARPPFAYLHELAKFFARTRPSLGWTTLLFGGDDGNSNPESSGLSRKEKLAFLARLVAVVSRVTGRRWDVLVSPSNILSGQSVLLTHEFLRAMASSVMASEEDMAKAVGHVLEEGDVAIYRRGVRTRKAFTGLQAMFRGRRVRRQCLRKSSVGSEATINDAEEPREDECTFSDSEIDTESVGAAESNLCHATNSRGKESRTKSKSKSDEEALLESYEAMLARKSQVEEDLQVAEAKLKRENEKLIRILYLGTKHKTKTPVIPYAGMSHPPLSAPSIGSADTNNSTRNSGSHRIDESFSERITNFSERQRTIKLKERRIAERESRLKQRFAKSKQKEAELKLQEQRIADLADKMRKQQMQLKEQRLQFERTKLLEEDAAPPETSRPCVLCTEKKIQMREIKSKVRQRARTLQQREAAVVARAQALRRRESDIVQREQMVAESEQQSTVASDRISECDEEPAPERQSQCDEEKEAPTESLPDVRNASKPPPTKVSRKRRRRKSPREETQQTAARPQEGSDPTLDKTIERSIRGSFHESIPTIVEETPADEEDEESAAEDTGQPSRPSGCDANNMECAGDVSRKVSEHPVPTNIEEARQHLGMTRRPKSRESSGPRSQHTDTDEPRIEPRRTPKASSPQKRHVFTFERRETKNNNRERHSELMPLDGNRGRTPSTPSRRERVKKPRNPSAREKPDDWISSFDVQMKCAMNRLKELV